MAEFKPLEFEYKGPAIIFSFVFNWRCFVICRGTKYRFERVPDDWKNRHSWPVNTYHLNKIAFDNSKGFGGETITLDDPTEFRAKLVEFFGESNPVTTIAPNGQDGCFCARSGCGFHPYVEPNQSDGTFLCRDHRGNGAFDWMK